jgi:hypothetical protein
LERLQTEGLGPSGTLANLLHIGEMKIDEMPEGVRIGAAQTREGVSARE